MKIYLYTTSEEKKEENKKIASYLRRANLDVLSNLDNPKKIQDFQTGESLPKIDLLIIHGDKLDNKSGYLTALTLAQNKQVLYLLPQSTKIDEVTNTLQKNHNFKKRLEIKFYQGQELLDRLGEFLEAQEAGQRPDLFNIKYTLRVSKKINDYLNWKGQALAMPKADWLRAEIEKMMAQDKGYQDFLKNKYKNKYGA